MQNVIVAKIDSDVADTFDARFVLTGFVGEVDTISAFEFALFHVFTLNDLRSSGNVQKHVRALIESVLHERRTVEFIDGKTF